MGGSWSLQGLKAESPQEKLRMDIAGGEGEQSEQSKSQVTWLFVLQLLLEQGSPLNGNLCQIPRDSPISLLSGRPTGPQGTSTPMGYPESLLATPAPHWMNPCLPADNPGLVTV